MQGSIKVYGLIIIGFVIIIFTLLFNEKTIGQDELFNAIRTTQLSTIKDSLNIGDLIVNKKLSINKEKTSKLWYQKFKSNISTNIKHDINIVDISTSPPAIAVRVTGNHQDQQQELTFDLSNVVLIDIKN